MHLDYQLKWNAVTHPGLKRTDNEDCLLSSAETGLWLVADGMGGHAGGEVASAIVRDTLEKLSQRPNNFSLTNAIQAAHQAILTSADQGVGVAGMGSTVVALLTDKKTFQVAWVGDSRAYLWTPSSSGGDLLRLTIDHSYVQMLFASGAITAAEREKHPDKHIITQCLGIRDLAAVSVDVIQRSWQKNQWVLLCSDGLSDELSDAEISTILAANRNRFRAAKKLLAAALQRGGSDNITLQIIESPVGQKSHPLMVLLNKLKPRVKFNPRLFLVAAAVACIALLFVAIENL